LTSPDGQYWTRRESPTNRTIRGLTFNDGLFVGVGGNRTIVVSDDALDWSAQILP
jgi:hypothetical protein